MHIGTPFLQPTEVNHMKHNRIEEDLLAISALLEAGKISSIEAHELREYVESSS